MGDIAFRLLAFQLAEDTAVVESGLCGTTGDSSGTLRQIREHPALFKTEADFCKDTNELFRLYRVGLRLAQQESLPFALICRTYAMKGPPIVAAENHRTLPKAKERFMSGF